MSAGRTLITPRALSRLACAVTGDALGVEASSVKVRLTSAQGNLGLDVVSPIQVAPLSHPRQPTATLPKGGESVLARAKTASEVIHARMGALTGRIVGAVNLKLAGVQTKVEGRVQ